MSHIACFTFDFDVWSGFASRGLSTPTPISRGEFGLVGARRLIDLLAKRELPSTWFVPGVIIDIRSNGGGLLGDAVEMTGELIDRGPVVQVQDSRDKRETLSDDDKGTTYDGLVVLMVDRFSASA